MRARPVVVGAASRPTARPSGLAAPSLPGLLRQPGEAVAFHHHTVAEHLVPLSDVHAYGLGRSDGFTRSSLEAIRALTKHLRASSTTEGQSPNWSTDALGGSAWLLVRLWVGRERRVLGARGAGS